MHRVRTAPIVAARRFRARSAQLPRAPAHLPACAYRVQESILGQAKQAEALGAPRLLPEHAVGRAQRSAYPGPAVVSLALPSELGNALGRNVRSRITDIRERDAGEPA